MNISDYQNKTKIVGFTGFKGSGKDTAADVLVEREGYRKLSFAAPLKYMLRALIVLQGANSTEAHNLTSGSLQQKETPSEFLNGKTARHAMQTLGTEWGRELMGQDFWVNCMRNYILNTQYPAVAISDVRFQNEVDMINELGGVVYKIIRPGESLTDNHISEAGIADLSGTIRLINSFQLPAFREDVANFILNA